MGFILVLGAKRRVAAARLKLGQAAMKAVGESGIRHFADTDNVETGSAARGEKLEYLLCLSGASRRNHEMMVAGTGG